MGKTEYYVKQWRLVRGMTQSKLAKKARLRRSTICEIERGRTNPLPETLEAIMQVLDITDAQIQRDPFARFNKDE